MLLASILSVANTSLLLYVVVTIVPLILYSVSAFRYKVYKEFPTAGLNGSISFRDIEKARQNLLANGSEIVKEGLRKVYLHAPIENDSSQVSVFGMFSGYDNHGP